MTVQVTIPGDLPVMASNLMTWVRQDKTKSAPLVDTLDQFHARAMAAMERTSNDSEPIQSVVGWAMIDGRPGEAFHVEVHADGTVTVLGVAHI